MQRPVSSFRAASSDHNHHVIDIMQQEKNSFRKGLMWQPWRRFRKEKSCHVIHAVPLVVVFCISVLWWFSYPVNLEIKDGRLIAARKIEVPPQLVNQSRIDYTILMKQKDTPPPDPSVISNSTLMNDTSSGPPNPIMMNNTSAEPPVPIEEKRFIETKNSNNAETKDTWESDN